MSTLSHKNPQSIGYALLVLFALVLSACGPASTPNARPGTATLAVDQAAAVPSATPTPAEPPAGAQVELTNPDFGFSLSYPQGFELRQDYAHSFTFFAPQGTPGERWRASLVVERGFDQDARWFAEQAYQENAGLGEQIAKQITTATSVIDGQAAYILGRMPGQELNRQVFVVYKGFLYHLTFLPDDPQAGEAYQQMEALYAAVTSSLRFLPERRDVAPVTSLPNMLYQLERALEARSEDDIVRPLGDEFFGGYWMPETPERVSYERLGRNDVSALILDKYLSQAPELTLERQVDWAGLFGDPFPFAPFFPDEVITPVLVKGWGPQGADEAVLIIGHRRDGSLFWRGMFTTQGAFAP